MDLKKNRFFVGPSRLEVSFLPGESVLEALRNARVPIDQSCGGGASCGTCRISAQAIGAGHQPRALEQEFIQERGFLEKERLACQLMAHEGLWVFVPLKVESNC